MAKTKPQYKSYEKGDLANSFINPYTFVSVKASSTCSKASGETQGDMLDVKEDEIVTGKLTCRLYLKTPLIIPDPDKSFPDQNKAKHLHYPFMKVDGKCIIPGSSIRGPVRSIYETVTNSCFSTMQEHQRITARTKKPFAPGVLFIENREMKLYPATRYRVSMDNNLQKWGYGKHLDFTGGSETIENRKHQRITVYNVDKITGIHSEEKTNPEDFDGYLFIGEKISGKKYESIFVIDNGANSVGTSEEIKKAYEDMKHAVDVYQNDSVNRNLHDSHWGYRHINFEDFENNQIEGLPIWFKRDGATIYLSPACIGRFTYRRTMEELLPENKPCDGSGPVCKACSLFGMVRRSKDGSTEDEYSGLGSHLRFGDAKLIEPSGDKNIKDYLKEITLEELSSPKPSYLPFYLNTSDFTKGYDGDGATIKGRKFYWHHNPDTTNPDKGERNATMEALVDPAEFEFTVYFDEITKKQLHELECVLCLGENVENGDLCYKIGHGKPLGYGSVKICVTSEEVRTFEAGNYRVSLKKPVDITKIPDFDQRCIDILNSVLSFSFISKYLNQVGNGVRYPFVVNGTNEKDVKKINKIDANALASHHWFSENYTFGGQMPKICLPATPSMKNVKKGNKPNISMPALELTDILKDNVSCFGSKSDQDNSNRSVTQKDELKKNQVIDVTLSWIGNDKDNPELYFGGFERSGKRGYIKNIPENYRKGTELTVRVSNPRTKDNCIFTEFLCEKGRR